MNHHDALLGRYVPGSSWLHRAPTWSKYLLVLGASLPALFLQRLEISLVVCVLFAAILASARLGLRDVLAVGRMVWFVIACLIAYHAFATTWQTGVMLGANIVGCLWAARSLTCTTPGPEMVDALVAFLRPLRWVGLDPERVGLAIGIMLRSIPHLMDSFDEVRDAARARGLERNLLAQLSPVVVHAVAYAQATGDALAARGLGDDQ